MLLCGVFSCSAGKATGLRQAEAAIAVFIFHTDVQGGLDEVLAVADDVVHLQVAGCRHNFNHIVTGEVQLAGVDEIQDDGEGLGAEDVEGGVDRVIGPLGQQHAEVAAAGVQNIAVSPEELALHQHTAVTEKLLATLLVELLQHVALVRHCDVSRVEPPLRLPAGDNMTACSLALYAGHTHFFIKKIRNDRGPADPVDIYY